MFSKHLSLKLHLPIGYGSSTWRQKQDPHRDDLPSGDKLKELRVDSGFESDHFSAWLLRNTVQIASVSEQGRSHGASSSCPWR